MSKHAGNSNNPQTTETLEEQVVDPGDYNRTQRFKEIHQARQRVSEFVAQMELPDDGSSYYLKETTRLAHLVALYILELEPLIIQSEFENGEFVADDIEYKSLRDFAAKIGAKYNENGNSTPNPQEIISIYSAANRFYARVGMDLEMDIDKGDAGFDYSDILAEGPPGGSAPDVPDDIGDENGGESNE